MQLTHSPGGFLAAAPLISPTTARSILRVLVICPDGAARESFKEGAAQTPVTNVCRFLDEYPDAEALDHVMRHFAPALVCISFEQADRAAAISEQVGKVSRGTQIVALSSQYQVDLLHRAMQFGARDFLTLPLDSGRITELFRRLGNLTREHPPEIHYSRNVLGFVSAKPGSGATTVALHAAAEFAKQSGLRTVLLDLDRRSSLLPFLLKLQNPCGVMDTIDYHNRLDESIWGRMVTKVGQMDCVSMGGAKGRPIPVAQLVSYVEYAQRNYDLVCLDLPSGVDPDLFPLMAECNELFVVTSLELGPIFLTNTAVRILRERFSDRVQVIVNRHRPSTLADAMESILEKPAFGVLPNCYDDLQDAISRGKLVRANTKYQAAIRKMVERSLGPAKPVEPTPQRMGILQSLTAMFRPLLPAAKS